MRLLNILLGDKFLKKCPSDIKRTKSPKENKITNAERCKAYRNRHKEAYKAKDALRKRIARENMKSKPAENRLRLQQQAAAKKALRLRKKLIIQAGKVLFISLK